MHNLKHFQSLIENQLKDLHFNAKPVQLYEPIRYMLTLGGKRMRPSLLLIANDLFGGNVNDALMPACGIEVFHNFTLLHDDIMDNAPVRRAKQTVHEKWNSNIAILSGDAMFVKSVQMISSVQEDHLKKVLDLFNSTALEVCEGQQMDMDFESRDDVQIDEYIEMIRLKTAVLLAASLEIGAITANANIKQAEILYDFGINLGIAFQLQDDLLDVYGNKENFGKQVGGDIISNKKTFLLLKALELAEGENLNRLQGLMNNTGVSMNANDKVEAVTALYDSVGVKELTQQKIDSYFNEAKHLLNKIDVSSEKKQILIELMDKLYVRDV
ncbi:MAG: polyprenyl synthetase family protein [Bacteroidia bacterium]|nr:polyprenyl synthetase family protein [Bacteroidia bacterium]